MMVRSSVAWRPGAVRMAVPARLANHPVTVDVALACLVTLVVFAVYNATLTPSLSYISPDGNELATTAYTLGVAHPTGYPLYTWLGKLFTFLPVGDVAHRVNLLSAVGGAVACGLLYGIARELRCGRVVALFAALLMGFSTTLWSQATIAEVYAPNLPFVALATLLLLRWGRLQRDPAVRRRGSMQSTVLFGAWALTAAASAGMHMSSLGLLPGFVVYILFVNWRVLLQPLVIIPGAVMFVFGLMQFLWLPIRSVMGEPLPDPINPATVDGFLNYTLNAFPQFKWVFPLELLPDRFMFYGSLVRANFGWAGVALGLIGAVGMSVRRPRTFIMLSLMWTVHVVFFMEYRAMDIDVFFIPAHFMFAIAIAYGALLFSLAVTRLARPLPAGQATAAVVSAVVLFVPLQAQLRDNYATHDQSRHTEINDFYRNVYRDLPPNSVLLGGSGVFGYDMFYYQYVYNLRTDVMLPSSGLAIGQRGIRPNDGRAAYTVEPDGAGPRGFGRIAASGDWYVPVLVAPAHNDRLPFLRRALVLYRVASTPPVVVDDSSTPSVLIGAPVLPSATLVGADVSSTSVRAGETVHLKLYWKLQRVQPGQVSLFFSDEPAVAESHQVGFGLFERYDREVAPIAGHTTVEEFDFVVLSSTARGVHQLTIRGGAADPSPVTLATIEVQ